MRVLDAAEIRALAPMRELIECLRQAFRHPAGSAAARVLNQPLLNLLPICLQLLVKSAAIQNCAVNPLNSIALV